MVKKLLNTHGIVKYVKLFPLLLFPSFGTVGSYFLCCYFTFSQFYYHGPNHHSTNNNSNKLMAVVAVVIEWAGILAQFRTKPFSLWKLDQEKLYMITQSWHMTGSHQQIFLNEMGSSLFLAEVPCDIDLTNQIPTFLNYWRLFWITTEIRVFLSPMWFE